MPTPTYDLIASNVLTSSASSVTFSSISGSYRDLVVVVNAITVTGYANVYTRFNADSGNNYSYVEIFGYSGGIINDSFSGTNQIVGSAIYSTNGALDVMHINDYAVTDKHKMLLLKANGADSSVRYAFNRWANTAAITSITFLPSASNFNVGSSFYLYGIVS